jgi:hypothetical protein
MTQANATPSSQASRVSLVSPHPSATQPSTSTQASVPVSTAATPASPSASRKRGAPGASNNVPASQPSYPENASTTPLEVLPSKRQRMFEKTTSQMRTSHYASHSAGSGGPFYSPAITQSSTDRTPVPPSATTSFTSDPASTGSQSPANVNAGTRAQSQQQKTHTQRRQPSPITTRTPQVRQAIGSRAPPNQSHQTQAASNAQPAHPTQVQAFQQPRRPQQAPAAGRAPPPPNVGVSNKQGYPSMNQSRGMHDPSDAAAAAAFGFNPMSGAVTRAS